MNPNTGSEPYRVTLTPAAARELRRLRADDAARLRRPILGLAFGPRPTGARPVVGSPNQRIRVGDLRVVYLVDDVARSVVITRVARRAESSYRRL